MTLNEIVRHCKNRGFLAGVSAIIASLAVVVIGYGIARPPMSSPLLSIDASASVPAGAVSTPVPQAALAMVSSAAQTPRAVAPGDANGRIDAPRECAPDRGITEACIY